MSLGTAPAGAHTAIGAKPQAGAQDAPIGRRAAAATFAWSLAQNWGGRLISFGVFVLLARLLHPHDFGLLSACLTVVNLIAVVSEFGYGDAIVQRPGLTDADVNLPFAAAVGASLLLGAGMYWQADAIAGLWQIADLAPVVRASCLLPSLTTLALFQEFVLRRHLHYRVLAVRIFVANAVGGLVAVALALAGYGVWSIVVQAYVVAVVGLAWLWSRPAWLPTRDADPASFRGLTRVGGAIMTTRLLDFASNRTIDLFIAIALGPTALGTYAAGLRIYQILSDVVLTAVYNPALSLLARIAHDRARLAAIYRETTAGGAIVSCLLFVGAAACAPEILLVLLGPKWGHPEAVAVPMLLFGALQSVENLNGPFLMADARSYTLLGLLFLKACIVIPVVAFLPQDDLGTFTLEFVAAQLVTWPVSFALTCRVQRLPLPAVLGPVLRAAAGALLAFWLVGVARPALEGFGLPAFPRGLALGVVFVIAYGAALSLVAREELRALMDHAATIPLVHRLRAKLSA